MLVLTLTLMEEKEKNEKRMNKKNHSKLKCETECRSFLVDKCLNYILRI